MFLRMAVKYMVHVADRFATLNVQSRRPVNQHTLSQTLYRLSSVHCAVSSLL